MKKSKLWGMLFILFVISILLLVIGENVKLKTSEVIGDSKYWWDVLSNVLVNLGIAIFIANIFNFIIGTESFVSYIRDKLINIIVNRDFITKLSIDERKKMLQEILKPPKELSTIYSGIIEYFNTYINESMALFNSHYRSGLVLNVDAYIDKDKSRVKVEIELNYRIYKVMGEYENLPVGFEDDDSKIIMTKITAPDNKEIILKDNELKPKQQVKDGGLVTKDSSVKSASTQGIPIEFKEYKHLDISRKFVEYGSDHWHMFTYRISQPCDKMQMKLNCHDNLLIKKCITYGISDKFNIEEDALSKKVTINCNSWLNPGYGLCVIVSTSEISKKGKR